MIRRSWSIVCNLRRYAGAPGPDPTESPALNQGIPRIAITPGEPAGIGPDLVLSLATTGWPAELVVIADPDMLARRAELLGLRVELTAFNAAAAPEPSQAGQLLVKSVDRAGSTQPGALTPANARYVLATLEDACSGCLSGAYAAMVTGPVHKSVINDAGVTFSGHTEFLAARTGAPNPVMLLVADSLRVALVTTHLPLREVADRIDQQRVRNTLKILHHGLVKHFCIARPRITVLGLNPHAGESGHLGHEEQEVINPVLAELRAAGLTLAGPVPADTAFTPARLAECDAVLAMYHDQGLPVLKNRGFGRAVNVTLGLPVIRTSVDHGTAIDLAGSGEADPGSLRAALELAIEIAGRQRE